MRSVRMSPVAIALGLLAGCGFVSVETGSDEHVGENVLAVSEREIPTVTEIDLSEPQIFRSDEEWEAWYTTEVPQEVRDHEVAGLPGPGFDDSVAVAGTLPVCDESTNVIHEGDGKIALALEDRDEQSAPCTEYLMLFTVYDVPLDLIGVSDPADAQLSPEYRRIGE